MPEKSGEAGEENRALRARLALVEEHLALVEARGDQLLREKRNQADLASALVAAVSELARLSDGQDAACWAQQLGLPACIVGQCLPRGLQREAAALRQPPATPTLAIPRAPAQKTLPIGLLFPDAGEHYLRMMMEVSHIPAVSDMLEKARPILGFDVLKLCMDGPAYDLAQASEAVTYIADLAAFEKLRHEHGEVAMCARVLAGQGTGEYAALAAAGVLSFEDGLELVQLRWDAIMEVARSSKHASAVVAGVDRAEVEGLCAMAAKRAGSGAECHISGEYCDRFFSVGGTERSIVGLKGLAETAGATAHVQSLPYAYHSPLLKPAGEKVSAFLDKVLHRMSPPRTSVYMSTTAAPVRPGADPKDIVAILKVEVTSPMLWAQTIRAIVNREGISKFYKVGPGTRVKNQLRHTDANFWRTMTSVEV